MISRDMYHVIKAIPRAPGKTTLKELLGTSKRRLKKINHISSILSEAKSANYIAFSPNHPYCKITTHAFCLTEFGQIGIEEYKHRNLDSRRSLWAIIISILGMIISTTISIIGLLLQQPAG